MELTSKRRFARKGKKTKNARGKGGEQGELGILQAVALAAVCFFISRACFLGQMFPAGAALAAALISKNALNLYLLPFMLLGVGSFYKSGIPIIGDLAALCGCGLVFLCAARLPLKEWQKAVITGAIVITANSLYYMAAGMSYRLSVQQLVFEGVLAAFLCGIFGRINAWALPAAAAAGREKNESSSLPNETEGVFSFCAGLTLLAVGSGFSWLPLLAAMTAVLFFGYFFGVSGGLGSAIACGLTLLLCEGDFTAAFLLAAGGVAAGFSRGQNRILAALCFAASVLVMGIPSLSINLTVPFYAPAGAAALLILIPTRWAGRLDAALSSLIYAGAGAEKKAAAQRADYLKKAGKNLDDLSALFAGQENKRQLLSYEFKAMSQILERARRAAAAPKKLPVRYRAEPAWAGYAGDQNISGDSALWETLPDGTFAMVLSDGMGKGKAAASESSLAVATVIGLLKAGLEVELVLKLLNSILLLNTEKEVFSTIDLAILDQKTGKTRLYKIGAAPTFIKRANRVECLNVSALPMGVVDGLRIDYVETGLNPGDQLILISDGVTDSRREDAELKWLVETIAGIRSQDPQTMCDLIMNRAVENYGLREKDDLTVLAVRME